MGPICSILLCFCSLSIHGPIAQAPEHLERSWLPQTKTWQVNASFAMHILWWAFMWTTKFCTLFPPPISPSSGLSSVLLTSDLPILLLLASLSISQNVCHYPEVYVWSYLIPLLPLKLDHLGWWALLTGRIYLPRCPSWPPVSGDAGSSIPALFSVSISEPIHLWSRPQFFLLYLLIIGTPLCSAVGHEYKLRRWHWCVKGSSIAGLGFPLRLPLNSLGPNSEYTYNVQLP